MYWSEVTEDSGSTIKRAKLDGTEVTTIVSEGLMIPGNNVFLLFSVKSAVRKLPVFCFTDGIAVDWVSQKLYWTDEGLDQIVVYDLSNGYRKILFNTNNGTSTSPRAIVVDPMNRYVNIKEF